MAYHLYSSFYYWNKKKAFSESSVFIITIFSVLLILFLVQSSAITYSTDVYLILVDILYHIADGIILIPALVLFWNLRHKRILYLHRALISLFVILNTFANVGYIFTFNSGIDIIREHAWIWDLIYNISYILLAGGLFWYDRVIEILNKKIDQSIILNKQLFYLIEKQNKFQIIGNNSHVYIDKENIDYTINKLITNAKNEISLLIYIQNKYSHNLIRNLNISLTNFKIGNNNPKIQILFDNLVNLKLLLSIKPTNLDIEYEKLDKILRADMIIFIIDQQHLIFIDLKNDMDPNTLLAIYSTNSNIILHFCNLFSCLINLSELREQSAKSDE
jgi:hypothetical protein